MHQILSRLRRSLRRCITARIENDDFSPIPPPTPASAAADEDTPTLTFSVKPFSAHSQS